MNVVQMMFLFAGTAFVTWWFLLGILNPFIDAALAIIGCALEIILTFFFGYISKASNVIEKKITNPVRSVTKRIHIPSLVVATIYFLIGAAVFVLDHFYATKIYAEDATTFYPFIFQGTKYWATKEALQFGGFFMFLSACYALGVLLRGLDKLLNRQIRISIVINR